MTETVRLARPARLRVSFRDKDVSDASDASDANATGAIPLVLPQRRMWPFALICGGCFVVFAAIDWSTISGISTRDVDTVFDLMFALFEAFWALGWSVGVVILGALTILLFSYGETARLQNGHLVHVARLGPLHILGEYDLARVSNVQVENADATLARVRFDYDAGRHTIGDSMPRPDADRLAAIIQSASVAAGSTPRPAPTAFPVQEARDDSPRPSRQADATPLSVWSLSGLALIGANLIPLAGVLFFGWDLASVLVLFWAESGVIGFYTALKMAVVGKLAALAAVPFFIGHFGGFMAGHFLLLYSFFIRGPAAAGPEPGVRAALLAIFVPLWMSIAALAISHGVSFVDNFLKRREYADTTMKSLMTAPYSRITVMQLTLIFGGWVILLLGSPVPALALLVVLKTAVDFSAHRAEHRRIR